MTYRGPNFFRGLTVTDLNGKVVRENVASSLQTDNVISPALVIPRGEKWMTEETVVWDCRVGQPLVRVSDGIYRIVVSLTDGSQSNGVWVELPECSVSSSKP